MIKEKSYIFKFNEILERKKSTFLMIFSLIFWLYLSFSYGNNYGFSLLQYEHTFDKNNYFSGAVLTKGKKITGTFTAQENNLGIVAVHMGEIPLVNEQTQDYLIFRIKNKDQNSWFYEQIYESRIAHENQYLPFGFEPVEASKGKQFTFELISLKGSNDSNLIINQTNPAYVSMYKFNKQDLLKDKQLFFYFLLKKFINLFINRDILLASVIYILPSIYLFRLRYKSRFKCRKLDSLLSAISFKLDKFTSKPLDKFTGGRLIRNKIFNTEFICLFIVIIFVIFFTVPIYQGNTATVILLVNLLFWIQVATVNSINSVVSYIFAFMLILVVIISISIKMNINIDGVTFFAYSLFIFGISQDIAEFIFKKNFNN